MYAGRGTLSLGVPASNVTLIATIILPNLPVFVKTDTLGTGRSALPVILPVELAPAQAPINALDAPMEL